MKRPVGAPLGNANSLKHGRYTLASRLLRMDAKSKRVFKAVIEEAQERGMAKRQADRLNKLVENGRKKNLR